MKLLVVVLAALVIAGCGGSADNDPVWTPRNDVKNFNGDVAPGDNVHRAEAIVRHQREDHCGQRLIEVRCEEQASSWRCEWRTDQGDGSTRLQKHPPHGIPVSCG